MKTVVEIGCGESPGPFFEGFEEHFIVDTDTAALEEAMKVDPRFTPMIGSDALSLDLPEASVDVVLARNVFGDPGLGIKQKNADMIYSLERIHLADGNLAARQELDDHVTSLVHGYKLRILQEAARVLTERGSIVIIEQYTPPIAATFIAEVTEKLPEMSIEPRKLFDVTPHEYAKRRAYVPGTRVWSGTKAN